MEPFEQKILEELSSMKDLLAEMNRKQTEFEGRIEKAIAETNGKLKGNHELIEKEFNTYVQKDSCEGHRTRQGERIGILTDEVHEMKTRLDISTKITTFVVGIIGVPTLIGIVYLIMLYQQVQSTIGG